MKKLTSDVRLRTSDLGAKPSEVRSLTPEVRPVLFLQASLGAAFLT
jgi:hypothetical protein